MSNYKHNDMTPYGSQCTARFKCGQLCSEGAISAIALGGPAERTASGVQNALLVAVDIVHDPLDG